MNIFGGTACLDVHQLVQHRGLDDRRFANLLMKEKSVALPHEDPVTYAVNAARPMIDTLSALERERIELLITCSESGIDFGKSMSTYIHHYLGLNRNCRLFEIKQACYSGTAGLQTAVNFVLSRTSPGAKALVIATDISRFIKTEDGNFLSQDWSYAEPSSGAGAVAILVSDHPQIFQLDVGASGYYGYEVMDTCRPIPDSDAGDADLSLLSYLDCCEQSFLEYQKRVVEADYRTSFQYLAFHTPFGGMVKGAHRTMMRKLGGAKSPEIEADFTARVLPGLTYCQRIGNIMGASIFLSLSSIIDHAELSHPVRVGCFSYGSGCCSEFYSGVVTSAGKHLRRQFDAADHLNQRYALSMEEYDSLLLESASVRFGTRNVKLNDHWRNITLGPRQKKPLLVLNQIKNFHREYEWVA